MKTILILFLLTNVLCGTISLGSRLIDSFHDPSVIVEINFLANTFTGCAGINRTSVHASSRKTYRSNKTQRDATRNYSPTESLTT